MAPKCTHLNQARVLRTDRRYCEECVRLGQPWVHLRLCLSCGHVGCCDSSPNRHASKHFLATGHPLVRSIEPGESWIWCYRDEIVAGEVE
ncbi:ubiquitin-hydrolase Zn-finger-containing protein [Paraburkholderia sp. BL8N3]|nr:UBP-type zinc finger domain-containing protein [Paraburkholderia sp. BL8N3]TCK32832.1 ubiquitin-hydrolase Zn-finger-containing protein [Paraburkholderia sp. BL8N3]